MDSLPLKLYRAEQVRRLDTLAIQQYKIPGYELMNRAGLFAFECTINRYPKIRSIAIFCGSGNNAGDGYVVARMAKEAGISTTVYSVSPVEKLHGDALTAFQEYITSDGKVIAFQEGMKCDAELTMDALLGTGLDRDVKGVYANAIKTINSLQNPVVSLDIPSGLNADTGMVMGNVVNADMTVTFIGLKQGLFTGQAKDFCGEIRFSSLNVPDEVYREVSHSSLRLDQPVIKPRSRCSHKGNHGHVLVIGGDSGFSGAAIMAAEAAARAGAGLVSVATRKSHAGLLNINRPELMCHGVENFEQIEPLLNKASVIAIGPGLGQSEWSRFLFEKALEFEKPMVIDADGLNLLSQQSITNGNWVLTPHPGEAARLLHCTTSEIQKDRFAAVTAIQHQYNGVCVLKGAGTLIFGGRETQVSTTGNPGMASGGFGDVLTGFIAGLIAQGLRNEDAAMAGVYLHGEAADLAAQEGERGLLASDLMPHIRKLVNRE